ncbi:Hemolymph lipopolysaccharide-binding protein [Blattella germanica]|nr:Hemolymph lipopolysaccharide-binding protein [Blattella germanica]
MYPKYFLIYTLACLVATNTALECSPPGSSSFKFSIKSRQNLTGERVAQIHMESNGRPKEVGILDVDIEQTNIECQDTENTIIIATISEPPRLNLGPGYEFVPGLGYYKIHTDVKTWHGAYATCAKEGAYLAIINSVYEFSILRELWDRHPKITDEWTNNYAYLGISDLETHKNFLTIFGDPVNSTGYTKWSSNQPNYDGHCVDVDRQGRLHDTDCDIKMPFFCEQKK